MRCRRPLRPRRPPPHRVRRHVRVSRTGAAVAPREAVAQPAKKTSHRQDKEYYEETSRIQKEATRKPKDAIPDESEEDFSTE